MAHHLLNKLTETQEKLKECIEKNIFYNSNFMQEQEDKINKFVSNYTHAITLQEPNQRVDKVWGKLVQLDEEINIVE